MPRRLLALFAPYVLTLAVICYFGDPSGHFAYAAPIALARHMARAAPGWGLQKKGRDLHNSEHLPFSYGAG
jgi:hypothetical protein